MIEELGANLLGAELQQRVAGEGGADDHRLADNEVLVAEDEVAPCRGDAQRDGNDTHDDAGFLLADARVGEGLDNDGVHGDDRGDGCADEGDPEQAREDAAAGHRLEHAGQGDERQTVVTGGTGIEGALLTENREKTRKNRYCGEHRDGHIAEALHGGGEDDIVLLLGIDAVGDADAPAGTGRPQALRQCFEPDLIVEQVGELQVEHEVQAGCCAGQRDGADGEDDDAREQDREEDLRGLLNGLDALVGAPAAKDLNGDVDQDRHPVMIGDTGEQTRLVLHEAGAGDGLAQILEDPCHDDGIVGDGDDDNPLDEGAEPGGLAGTKEVTERAGQTLTGAAADDVLAHHHGDDGDEHDDHIGHDEGRAAVCGHHAREAPDVARTDGGGNQGNRHHKRRRKASAFRCFLFIHGVKTPL